MLLLISSHKTLDQTLFIGPYLRLEHIAEVSNHRPFCLHFAFYMAIIHQKPIIRSSRIREYHPQILLPVLSKAISIRTTLLFLLESNFSSFSFISSRKAKNASFQ